MTVDVVLGLQRGDEGKGRFVDLLAADYDVVARFNGGPNAGHTVAFGDKELRLHQVPSGVAYDGVMNVIGNGCYIDPIKLLAEIEDLRQAGVEVTPKNLRISADVHLILPHHISLDEVREAGPGGQGSTKSGIAYVARDKYERIGVRGESLQDIDGLKNLVENRLAAVQDLRAKAGLSKQNVKSVANEWAEKARQVQPFIDDTFQILRSALQKKAKVLAEGAQATGLDIEHGMYPYVTSSHVTTGGVLNGLGLGPQHIGKVTGVAKVLRSHVGGGPFVTEEKDPARAEAIRGQKGKIDSEYGATTGRVRKVGYLDLPELRRAIWVNGVTELALTKLDLLPRAGDKIPVCTHYTYKGKKLDLMPTSADVLAKCQPVYEYLPSWKTDVSKIKRTKDLPKEAQGFITFVEQNLGVRVSMIGVGPYREQVICL